MLGLAVAFRPATIGEAFADSQSNSAQKENTMTQTSATQAADKTTIRPFQVNTPEAELAELRGRINSTRWPDRETVTDESQGLPLATIQELARYWATDYDWRKIEAKLNALPQFITEIDGLDIHFIHVRSKHENALPDRHARMARLSHRAVEDYRSADESNGTWRERSRRFPSGNPVPTGLRVFSQAYLYRLGSGAHCKCLGSADEAPWIRKICGTRRRFGRGCLHCDGQARNFGIAGNPHQLSWDHSIRHSKGASVRRSPAVRSLGRRKP